MDPNLNITLIIRANDESSDAKRCERFSTGKLPTPHAGAPPTSSMVKTDEELAAQLATYELKTKLSGYDEDWVTYKKALKEDLSHIGCGVFLTDPSSIPV